MSAYSLDIVPAQTVPIDDIPHVEFHRFREEIITAVSAGYRIACLCGDQRHRAWAVIADDARGRHMLMRSHFPDRYPSITPDCPQAHLFEREIAEQLGVIPVGHPWLKPLRFHETWWCTDGVTSDTPVPACGVIDFYRVDGDEIHEVAVGPVHAGVIEPGHFRFQCHGELVYHLEISLGYQHRGLERSLIGGPGKLTMKHMETAAGDTSIGHAWTYARIIESMSRSSVSERCDLIRGISLELERLANHTGDLGAIAGDIGFLPTAAYCGRIRGDWLNMTAVICGSRLGRDLIRPGGDRFDVDAKRAQELRTRLEAAWSDVSNAVELLWQAPSVMSRLEGTGVVTSAQAIEIGAVGLPARASGIARDIRSDYPHGPYCAHRIEASVERQGDVLARALIRWKEIQSSVDFIRWALDLLIASPHLNGERRLDLRAKLPADHVCFAVTEGWRGEVMHLAVTDADGRFSRYKIIDPSFHNWYLLALAMRNGQISDFPMCNKSFNLSYCGHDL